MHELKETWAYSSDCDLFSEASEETVSHPGGWLIPITMSTDERKRWRPHTNTGFYPVVALPTWGKLTWSCILSMLGRISLFAHLLKAIVYRQTSGASNPVENDAHYVPLDICPYITV